MVNKLHNLPASPLTILIALILSVLLGACVSTAPLDNAPFSAITNVKHLEGKYKNQGDGGKDAGPVLYLSKVLWPNDDLLDHKSIEIIEVKKTTENALLVNGLNGNEILKATAFVYGKDFNIENGVIVLSSEAGIAGFRSGEPMLGVYAGGSKIGLDEKGHGKYYSSATAAGLVYMFLPMVVSGSEDVRFYRVE